jgi:hydrogenase maturation protease
MNCHLAASLKTLGTSILVIGYGNPLRQDDGVGQRVAQTVARWQVPNVHAIALHQLTPDLAEQMAEADLVIFVDAEVRSHGSDVQLHPIALAETGTLINHTCDPSTLLAITQALYQTHPRAWSVLIPGTAFEFGHPLSPMAENGIETALEIIDQLIRSERPHSPLLPPDP